MTAVGSATTRGDVHTASPRSHLAAIGLGHAMEWYDWGVYAIFAPFFAARFFDTTDPAGAFLSTLAVFAVGFGARPLGGLLFGPLTDRRGRRYAMTLTVTAMAGSAFLVGVIPSYDVIGLGAPILLVLARMVQGMACGGELPAAQTYLAEIAPPARRGRWSSLIYIASVLGNTVGLALGLLLSVALTDQQLHAWGWRIPFLLGGVFGLVTLYMRRTMSEPDVFRQQPSAGHSTTTSAAAPEITRPSPGMTATLVSRRRAMLQVVGLAVGFTITYYSWVVAAPSHAIATLRLDPAHALTAAMTAALVFMAMMPAWGALSDRIGRKPVLLISVLGSAVLQFPVQHLVRDSAVQLFVALVLAMIPLAAGVAILPAVYAEMFPTGIRASGLAVPYSVTVAVFGGSAPYLQEWTHTHRIDAAFDAYIVVALLLTAVTVLTLPETRGASLTDDL